MTKRIMALLLAALLLPVLPAAALAEDGTPPPDAAGDAAGDTAGEAPGTGETAGGTEAPDAAPTPEASAAPATQAPEASESPAVPEASETPAASAAPTQAPATPIPVTPPPAATQAPSASPDAESAGNQRVTMGADLTDVQREAVYRDFGIEPGSVRELIVTNQEERAYLEGLVPERKIGSVALSCIYITTLEPGAGLDITIYNINYCTEQMYVNALTTAGITDARVIVSAPFPVSGTGALTGVYKAYEDITGTALNDLAKLVGAEELVVTGELAEYIGSEEAAGIVASLKEILDQTQAMSDDEVRSEIRRIAEAYSVAVTDAQVQQLLDLVRKLEGLDTGELQQRLTGLAQTAQAVNTVSDTISRVYESVKDFFASVGDFFVRLFGGGD